MTQSTSKQIRARMRNWQKARLTSFFLIKSVLLPEEIEKYREIIKIQKSLLDSWDINTPFINNQIL